MNEHYRVTQLYLPEGVALEPYINALARDLAPGEEACIWQAPGLLVTLTNDPQSEVLEIEPCILTR